MAREHRKPTHSQPKRNRATQPLYSKYPDCSTRILDPACGSGAFLVTAFDYLQAEYKRINDKLAELTRSYSLFDLNKEILNRNLYGVDLNAESIEITKLSLWLKTAEKGKALNSLKANLHCANSLINDPEYSDKPFDWRQFDANIQASQEDLFNKPEDNASGFDVILGNPPYVRQEFFSADKPYLQEQYAVYHGVADLYSYFFELGIKLLKDGGRMGYISSSTFFKTGSGQNLRRYIMDNARLENVVDFGDLQIFKGVTTYPAILCLQKQAPSAEHQINNLVLRDSLPEDLHKAFEQDAQLMSQSHLEDNAWRLESDALLALRHKITADKPSLKAVYGSPLYGIKTGFNAAFVIDRQTRDALIKADPSSQEVIKPFLEGKDLKKWRSESRDLYLIFTRRGIEIEKYPAVLAYLEQFKTQLEPKPKNWEKGKKWQGRKAGTYQWYEIQDTVAYHAEFEKNQQLWTCSP